MKALLIAISFIAVAVVASCDMRSGTAKEEMDKFSGTPTPTITPPPTPTPVDPADVVQVDTAQEGERLTVNGHSQNKSLTCTKYDRIMVNGSQSTATIMGACRQIMINGDNNQITADAAAEMVLNGTGNSLKYSRFVNGKQPVISENQSGNTIEKIPYTPAKASPVKKPAR
jgi:hypothetical protein